MGKYCDYTIFDFLDDPDFMSHLKNPDLDSALTLRDWRASNPPNAEAYDNARLVAERLLSVARIIPSDQFTDALYADIDTAIASRAETRKRIRRYARIGSAAAAFVGFFLGILWYVQATVTISTGNGEIRSATLPDSSIIHLNANSSVTYRRAWQWFDRREVYTTGEVMLNVKHLNVDPSKKAASGLFTAYSGDLAIDVLGTTFNIKNRDNSITVSLLVGKIKLRDRNAPTDIRTLVAGDEVQYQLGRLSQVLPVGEPVRQSTSWTSRNMVAVNLSVAEMIQEFRHLYGQEIVVRDTALLNKRIDGRVSLSSRESILYSLANILEARIETKGDTIILNSK